MDASDFDRVHDAFERFHDRFAPLFGRREARERSRQYVQALLVGRAERRNAENLAEAVEGATPRALQRFLTESPWSMDAVVAELQAFVGERLSTPEGVWVPDETGFPKKGEKSAGVQRQYSGTLGKVGNCQVGVFLAYAAPRAHAAVDGRLYLPEAWTDDPARCREAGVPERAIDFRTKPRIALDMIEKAEARGHLEAGWVSADEVYGNAPDFRDGVDAAGLLYVLEVRSTLRVVDEDGRIREVRDVRAALPEAAWREITVGEGSQGPRTYRFARLRAQEIRKGEPGRASWLLFRENVDGSEPRHFLSNAPMAAPLDTLARVASVRWAVEEEFQTLKGECGLDEYEVRSWPGWHHHAALAMLAGAFLLDREQGWGENVPGPHAATGRAGAPRNVAAGALERSRASRLAREHAAEERACQTIARQTSPTQSITHAA